MIWFQLFQICGNERCEKCIACDTTIVVQPGNCFGFPHFVHVMEYCYFFTDILLHNKHRKVIVKRPLRKYHSPYVDSFLETLSRVTNFKFCDDIESQNDVCEYIFNHEEKTISDNFIINNTFKNGIYVEWFMNDTTHIMRDLFLPDISPTKINIGLINRKNNRILVNAEEICKRISDKFGMQVNVTYFENTSFSYQIEFFRNNQILINAHGAHLASIPFAPDNALIIECCSNWHPYQYFPGLSYTSKKYHVVIRDNHDDFPSSGKNNRLDITTSPEKIVSTIETYIKNGMKLSQQNCYLF